MWLVHSMASQSDVDQERPRLHAPDRLDPDRNPRGRETQADAECQE